MLPSGCVHLCLHYLGGGSMLCVSMCMLSVSHQLACTPYCTAMSIHVTQQKKHAEGKDLQPVGAHNASFLPRPFHRSTMYLVVVVLPQPGPPVRIHTGAVAACITACLCPSDSLKSFPACPNIQCLYCLLFACTVASIVGKWKLCKICRMLTQPDSQ